MADRVADAMRRGSLCAGSIDFMRVDWFDLAERSVDEVRRHFCVPQKSPLAVASGSVGPWEPVGISPFQVQAGMSLAQREERASDPFGARVTDPA
jgi:hypothetical protein